MGFRDICLRYSQSKAGEARCLIIGEVAQSHDGSLGLAHAFIDGIAGAGADAVKFQTHIAAAESTPAEPWRVKFSRQDATRYDYWKRMEFTKEQWAGLKQHADDRGLLFMSTPFSDDAVDLLTDIGMNVWKMGSGEIGNLPLLERIAARNQPVILSSGMSGWEEIDAAVELLRTNGSSFAVLQCTSAYPCPPEDVGLNLVGEIRSRYDCASGLSDHSGKIYAGLAAAALGAEVLEVHVAMSREMFGPDVPASVTTSELAQLVEGTRLIEKMVGTRVDKDRMAGEMKPLRDLFTKSIVAGSDLPEGTILQDHHLKLKKPGTGLPGSKMEELVGRTLARDMKADELLSFQDVS
jgi:N,N'-diacetyllegionaminate synthase